MEINISFQAANEFIEKYHELVGNSDGYAEVAHPDWFKVCGIVDAHLGHPRMVRVVNYLAEFSAFVSVEPIGKYVLVAR